jgi:hypothetical protein
LEGSGEASLDILLLGVCGTVEMGVAFILLSIVPGNLSRFGSINAKYVAIPSALAASFPQVA